MHDHEARLRRLEAAVFGGPSRKGLGRKVWELAVTVETKMEAVAAVEPVPAPADVPGRDVPPGQAKPKKGR